MCPERKPGPEVGLGLVTWRDRPVPQGQRKELPGPEGKGSGPCMEENELYSSTTTGEGVARPPRAWWEEVWA